MLPKLTVLSLNLLVYVIIIWQMVNLVFWLMEILVSDYVMMLHILILKMKSVKNF